MDDKLKDLYWVVIWATWLVIIMKAILHLINGKNYKRDISKLIILTIVFILLLCVLILGFFILFS